MKYYSALAHEPLAANWKTVAEGLVESLHVPFVHRATFNVDPAGGGERFQSISAVDLAVYDRFGPHVRYSLPMFGQNEIAEIRKLQASGRSRRPAGSRRFGSCRRAFFSPRSFTASSMRISSPAPRLEAHCSGMAG